MADAPLTSNSTNLPFINLAEQSADPDAPSTGRVALYVKSGSVYVRRSTGSPVAAGGVPALAHGRLAVGDGSDTLSALALGATGQVVTADASGYATWAAGGGGGGGAAGHINLFCYAVDSTSGGGNFNATANASNIFYTLGSFSTPAVNARINFKAYVEAGTWTLRCYYAKNSTGGIAHIFIDETDIGTLDCYAATPQYTQVATFTGITVSSGALSTISMRVLSKNASSSSYNMWLTVLALWRTA